MFGLGFGEILLILIVALIFIGPKKLPELAKGLGKGLREFQDAVKGVKEDVVTATQTDTTQVNKTVESTPQEPAQAAAETTTTDDSQLSEVKPVAPQENKNS